MTKAKDKVSVVTTFYNAKEFLINAVNSINQQVVDETFEIEYVLVNDCSTDNSLDILNAFIEKHVKNKSQWKVFTPKKNLGCGGARKYGIEHATGNYFMFLDADDYYIHKDFIRRAHIDIINKGADIVEYGMVFNRAGGNPVNSVAPKEVVIENPHLAELAIFRDNLIKFNVWTKIYKREIVESFTYSDTRLFEDVRTIPVWVSHAKRIVVMPTVEINYRAASGSIIRDDVTKTRLGTISAIAEHFEQWKDDAEVLKAMYGRAMIDLEAILHNHSSENEGFNEMSALNTKMLKYIYPDSWQEKVFEVDQ